MKDSSWGRLIGALVAPGETFRSIAERPTWLPPLLILVLLGVAVGYVVQMKVDPEEMVRGQAGMFGAEVPQAEIDKAVESVENRSAAAKAALAVLGLLIQAAVYFVVAGLFTGAFK